MTTELSLLSRVAYRGEEIAAEYRKDEEILVELIRAEAATSGPAAALARYDTYRRALVPSWVPTRAARCAHCTRSCCARSGPRSGTAWCTSRTRCSGATATSTR